MTVTDQPEQELTPEQEAQVRRLLADARHTEPPPDAVVARLDKVLAGLADEPAREATVVRLADRRRRAATMLVAAAAVVVVGIGIAQVIPGDDGGGDAATSAEFAEDADAPNAIQGEDEGQPPSEAPQGESYGSQSGTPDDRAAFRVSSERFARDAATLQVIAANLALSDGQFDLDQRYGTESGDLVSGRAVCEPGAWGRGRFVSVVYDKAPGWLVLRKPQGESQIADLFLCGSEVVVRSVTLPYP